MAASVEGAAQLAGASTTSLLVAGQQLAVGPACRLLLLPRSALGRGISRKEL